MSVLLALLGIQVRALTGSIPAEYQGFSPSAFINPELSTHINARSLTPEPEENETQALQGYLHIGITNNVKMFAATMIQASLCPWFQDLPRVGLCDLTFGGIRVLELAALGSGSAGLELCV